MEMGIHMFVSGEVTVAVNSGSTRQQVGWKWPTLPVEGSPSACVCVDLFHNF